MVSLFSHVLPYSVILHSFFQEKQSGVFAKLIMLKQFILASNDYIINGNKSKVWNKFDSWCFKLAGLSKVENSKLHNVHFVSTSNKLSALDQAVPIAEELKVLEEASFITYIPPVI